MEDNKKLAYLIDIKTIAIGKLLPITSARGMIFLLFTKIKMIIFEAEG